MVAKATKNIRAIPKIYPKNSTKTPPIAAKTSSYTKYRKGIAVLQQCDDPLCKIYDIKGIFLYIGIIVPQIQCERLLIDSFFGTRSITTIIKDPVEAPNRAPNISNRKSLLVG